MNPGDVLLYQSPHFKFSNLISNGVRLIEGNKVTHVALYLGADGSDSYILEALEDGVYIKTISDLVNRDNGSQLYGIAYLSDKKFNFSDLYIVSDKYSGLPYGYLTDLNLLLQHGKTRLFANSEWTVWFKSKHGYICSELTQLVIQELAPELQFPKIPALTEPDDYLKAPWTVKII